MCSIVINKINKDLANIVRKYLLPEKEYDKIVKVRKYHSEISNIKSQYLYLRIKEKILQYVNLIIILIHF